MDEYRLDTVESALSEASDFEELKNALLLFCRNMPSWDGVCRIRGERRRQRKLDEAWAAIVGRDNDGR